MALGSPRLHLRETTSTNDRARDLALAGAPHGTLVTASSQTAGRGRQGRTWTAPAGTALLMSVVVREPPALLSLAAAVGVAGALGERAQIKWPNDVLIDGRKVAGILIEGRPQDRWAVMGIGVNVAVEPDRLPAELRESAGTLGRAPAQVESVLSDALRSLDSALALTPGALLDAWRARDVLFGREVSWSEGRGIANGIDDRGRLVVDLPDGETAALDAGEVHLEGGRA